MKGILISCLLVVTFFTSCEESNQSKKQDEKAVEKEVKYKDFWGEKLELWQYDRVKGKYSFDIHNHREGDHVEVDSVYHIELDGQWSIPNYCYFEINDLLYQMKNVRSIDVINADKFPYNFDFKKLPHLKEFNTSGETLLDSGWVYRLLECKTLRKLSIGSVHLDSLPCTICELDNLEELHIGSSVIKKYPKCLKKMDIKVLTFGATYYDTVPSIVWEIESLEKLKIEGRDLIEVPKEIGNLKSLKEFELNKTNTKAMPSELGNLSNLERIEFWRLGIKELPNSLDKLRNLREVQIVACENLSEFPNIKNALALKELYVDKTSMSELPDFICSLRNIEKITYLGTGMKSIPNCIGNLDKLKRLDLRGSKLRNVPSGIMNCKSLKELKFNTEDVQQLRFKDIEPVVYLLKKGTRISCNGQERISEDYFRKYFPEK